MIIHGDCLQEMQKMEANSISAIVTDPPYGLKFMGKGWDHSVPGVEFWKEALRICNPGSVMLCFGGTRTFHRLTCAIEDAGWEIRDCLMWLYGSGFPKSHNKFGIEGYGTALKPAWEPIILAMKPCDGTFAQNAEKWGQAGLNIDRCRIGTEIRIHSSNYVMTSKGISGGGFGSNQMDYKNRIPAKSVIGRWPANLILDEEAGKMMNDQNGKSVSKSGGITFRNESTEQLKGLGKTDRTGHNDSGGASRFFYCAKASSAERNNGCEELQEREKKTLNDYVNPSEGRTASKSGSAMKNFHPTVKPLKLMEYLIKLIMPPKDGVLLDPFCGSGSTLIAAKKLGFQFIGIELEKDYCEIAEKRLEVA